MSQAHLDDFTLVVDNDEGALEAAREVVERERDNGPSAVGHELIAEYMPEEAQTMAESLLGEFLLSISAYDLGSYYMEQFPEESEGEE